MSKALSELFPLVTPWVLGAPNPAIEQAVLQTLIEFCEDTRAWQTPADNPAVIDLLADTASYAVPVPTGANSVVVLSAKLNNIPLTAHDGDFWNKRNQGVTGTPLFYTQYDPNTITIDPVPGNDMPDALVLRVAYKPAQNASTVPDFLFDQYAAILAAGAVARLQGVPGTAYADANAAAYQRMVFEQGRDKAKTDVARGFTRSPFRSKLHGF